jgi:ribosomal protein S18 acetylase RimI-like enzyme
MPIIAGRPEIAGDEQFLRDLILSTVEEELRTEWWPAALRDAVLNSQYDARRQAWRIGGAGRTMQIILADGAPAGLISVADLGAEIRIVDLMVVAELRAKGIGAAAVRDVIASAGDRPVRLNVNVTNSRAARFYERLGFRRIGGDEVQHHMEHRAAVEC